MHRPFQVKHSSQLIGHNESIFLFQRTFCSRSTSAAIKTAEYMTVCWLDRETTVT